MQAEKIIPMKYYEKIIEIGKTIIPEFEITDELAVIYEDIYTYFSKQHGHLDLKKGLLLTGSIGTGKTTAMKIFSKMFHFGIVSTRYIIREFNTEGMSILDHYGRNSYMMKGVPLERVPTTICFDDLGMEETNSQLFGNKANVMGEILLDRYDCYIKSGMITHGTTNLLINDLENIYGDRIRDRLREMMNLVIFKGKSLRK